MRQRVCQQVCVNLSCIVNFVSTTATTVVTHLTTVILSITGKNQYHFAINLKTFQKSLLTSSQVQEVHFVDGTEDGMSPIEALQL